jgi:hypothetical protein
MQNIKAALTRVVGLVIRLRAGQSGVRIPVEVGDFSLTELWDPLWGPPSLIFNVYWGLFSRGLKRSAPENDHSPSTSAEVDNE